MNNKSASYACSVFFSEMDENYARNYLRNMLKIITRGTSKLSQISLA